MRCADFINRRFDWPRDVSPGVNPCVVAYIAVSGVVLLLLLGLALRLAQAEWLPMPPDFFYEMMTAHGVGMVGIAGLAGAGIMWHFLGRYVGLSQGILVANLVLFLAGVVMILAAVFLGGFGGAWTFLYPLPATSGGVWELEAAGLYLGGLLVVGVGFLLFYLDAGRAIIAEYGGLGAALGWPVLIGSHQARLPEPTVIASTMVVIVNTLGLISGATVLGISLINIAMPSFVIDPLLAKNMTYFFGHVFINATIYMTVIAVYEILPGYTGREWRASKLFLWGWTASTILVLIAFPHHLLMDFVMPRWALVIGQIASYAAGLPVLVVTAYGALTLVYRSGIRWDAASSLLFLSRSVGPPASCRRLSTPQSGSIWSCTTRCGCPAISTSTCCSAWRRWSSASCTIWGMIGRQGRICSTDSPFGSSRRVAWVSRSSSSTAAKRVCRAAGRSTSPNGWGTTASLHCLGAG